MFPRKIPQNQKFPGYNFKVKTTAKKSKPKIPKKKFPPKKIPTTKS